MTRKLKLWKALVLTMLGGLISTFLGLFHFGKTSEAQEMKAPPSGEARRLYDNHWLPTPIPGDADQDLILDAEETALGLDPGNPDQNRSGVIDGPELADMLDDVIDGLPYWNPGQPDPAEIVKTDFIQYGVELCHICGAEVNMGFLRITNPWNKTSVDIHYIAMHYLHHGSFEYDGTLHQGRIDVEELNRVLEDLHRLPVSSDTDGDLLSDSEEIGIGTDPADADENGNFKADGVDEAGAMKLKIDLLPYGPLPDKVYKIDNPVWGDENCEICGEAVNMGFLEITDPVKGLTLAIPYIGLHYMDHGSYSYNGTINDGRVDVVQLHEILKDAR